MDHVEYHIHAGSLEGPRLKPIFDLLRSRGDKGATSFELQQASRVTSVSAAISEIRSHLFHSGGRIKCTWERNTGEGRKVCRYRLINPGRLF